MEPEGQGATEEVKSVGLELISSRIMIGLVFLLPLFVLPFGIFAVDFNKAMFLYIGVSVATIFFLVGRINKRSIVFPKSFILASLFFVALAWLTVSVFSGNVMSSLVGFGYETGTFAFFLFLSVVSFLISVLFSSAKRLVLLYKALFVSAFVLFVMQLLHTGFGLPIPPWEIFQNRLASVLGNWNDLGIFFGLISLLSLSSLEFVGENKRGRIFLWLTLTLSLVAVFFVNFSTLQYVLGFSVLALLLYRLINPPHFEESPHREGFTFLSPSFVVFLLIVVFSVMHQWIGELINFLGIQFTQVNPSWTATLAVISGVISSDLFFGSGPNTFSYDWMMFKPEAISNTIFWDARFQSGAGRLPSMVAEVGIIGGTAIMVFICSILYAGKSVVSCREHSLERMLLVSSFFGSVYLWIFTIIYSPGFLVFSLAGVFTGIFIASLGFLKEKPFIEIIFKKGEKKSVVIYFIATGVILFFAMCIYVFTSKYIASYYYTAGLKEATIYNNLEKADLYLRRAMALDSQDVYFRSSAEIGLAQLGQIVARSKETASDSERAQFGNILKVTVQSAKNATIVNPIDPENWMELGRVYEAILQLDTNSFKDSVIFAYKEALHVSPKDPRPLLALARVELQAGDAKEALKYLNESLKIKSDFSAGHIMLAEVAVSQGALKEAIAELDRAVSANPNNPDNIYIVLRIGVLYYQDGYYEKAQNIFENLVSVNPNYVDARYSLGLLYDRKGMIEMAIGQFEAIKKLLPENSEVQRILENLHSGRDVFGNSIAAPEPTPVSKAPVKKSVKKK